MVFIRSVIILIVLSFLLPGIICADNYNSSLVTAVVVSKKIRPYAQALDGIKEAVIQRSGASPEVLWYDSADQKEKTLFEKNAAESRYAIIIAVGPQAASYLWRITVSKKTKRFYTVVFDPDKILNKYNGCGISLQIPVNRQIEDLHTAFPHVDKIALVFDPQFNNDFYTAAAKSGQENNLTIIPVTVESRSGIKDGVKSVIEKCDLMWLIPDPTVISQSTVEYIIKYTLKKRKGVIGYNRYFFESGCVFSFEFDYRAIGIQTAKAAFRNYSMGECTNETPLYNTLLNYNVARKINLKIKEK